jgi:hypothetical protein
MWDLTPGGQHGSVLRMEQRQQYSHYANHQNDRKTSTPGFTSTYRREVRNTRKTTDSFSKQLKVPYRRWVQDYAHQSMLGLMSSVQMCTARRTVLRLPLAPPPSFWRPSPPPKTVCLVQRPFPCTSPTCSYFLLHWLNPQGVHARTRTHTHTVSVFFSPWARKKEIADAASTLRVYTEHQAGRTPTATFRIPRKNGNLRLSTLLSFITQHKPTI